MSWKQLRLSRQVSEPGKALDSVARSSASHLPGHPPPVPRLASPRVMEKVAHSVSGRRDVGSDTAHCPAGPLSSV